MSVKIQAAIDRKEFIDSVEKGIKLAQQRLNKSTNKLRLKIDEKGFRQPLGRITGDLNMFDSALAASNARVIAFGASTAIIGGVSRAFRDLAKSTIEVEKAFIDINRILGMTSKQFESFGNKLFDIGKKNAAAFQDLTKASLEFARQGLSTEEVLKRTSDALTLVRLTGINADKAVASLTATVNAFDGTMLTTTEALNKFVAVETKFAVGARDLVEALGRVGSSAQDAKVGFDELNAVVTSVQQTTGRGGAVIGNALKTIFTRLQRQDTLDALEAYGVAVRDVEGQTLPAIRILNNFSKAYSGLRDSSQAYLREQVAGVFQGNILSAILKDLTKDTNTFNSALDASTNATNEADQATAKLNQSLDAMSRQAGLAFKELQQNVGKSIFEPTAKRLLGPLIGAMEGLNDVIDGEGVGSDVANSILKGIGNVLGGPALVATLGLIAKVFFNTTAYIAKALPSLAGMTTETQKRANIEQYINSVLSSQSDLSMAIAGHEGNAKEQAKLLAGFAETTAFDMERQQKAVSEMALTMSRMKGAYGNVNVAMGGKRGSGAFGRGASGFIPGVAGEVNDIRKGVGGVKPSAKPVTIPNFAFGGGVRGTMVANTGEYIVPNFSNGGSAIFNPNMIAQYGMPAGARPVRGASGYVPNFAGDVNRALSILDKYQPGSPQFNRAAQLLSKTKDPSSGLPYIAPSTLKGQGPKAIRGPLAKKAAERSRLVAASADASPFAAMLVPQVGANRKHIHKFTTKATQENAAMLATGGKVQRLEALMYDVYGPSTAAKSSVAKGNVRGIEKVLDDALVDAAEKVIRTYNPALTSPPINKAAIENEFLREGGQGAMESFKGALFEALVQRIIGNPLEKGKGATTTLDVAFSGASGKKAADFFGIKLPPRFGDVKSNSGAGNTQKFTEQVLKNLARTGTVLSPPAVRGAAGYVPNFAALGDAVEREAAAGVPLGSIRVGRSSKLVTPNNPAGLGVTNTKDEPRGLQDVVGRGARGYVPNFFLGGLFGAGDQEPRIGKLNLGKLQVIVDGVTKSFSSLGQDAKIATTMAKDIATDLSTGAISTEKAKRELAALSSTVGMTAKSAKKLESQVMKASKGGGMFSRMMGSGGGMGVGMALSFAAPMAGGVAQQMGYENAGAALTGAGTGAAIGMLAGPVGALVGGAIGAGVGFFVSKLGEASRELEKMNKQLSEYNTETQQTTGAGQGYLQAIEALNTEGLSEVQLANASKNVADQFERIRGTDLETVFADAGTNVELLTKSLADYQNQRMRGEAVQRAAIGSREFKFLDGLGKDIDLTKMPRTLLDRRELEIQDKMTSIVGLGPKGSKSYQEAYDRFAKVVDQDMFETEMIGGEKTLEDATRRFSSLTRFFDRQTDDEGRETAKLVTQDFSSVVSASKDGLTSFAQALYALQGQTFESVAQIEEAFQGLAGSNLQFVAENLSKILAPSKLEKDVKRQANLQRAAAERFSSIPQQIDLISQAFTKTIALSKNLNKIEEAYIGERINIMNSLNMGLEAASEKRLRAEESFEIKRSNLTGEFFSTNAGSITTQLRSAGFNSDAEIRSMRSALNTMAQDPIEGLNEFLEQFGDKFTDKVKEAKFKTTIQGFIGAFEIQRKNLEAEQTISDMKLNIEKKRAENAEVEKRTAHERRMAVERQSQLFQKEQQARNIGIAQSELALQDPRTFRGMNRTQKITRRQAIEDDIAADRFEGRKAEAIQDFKARATELIAQQNLIDSNYKLLEADQQLITAVERLKITIERQALEATAPDGAVIAQAAKKKATAETRLRQYENSNNEELKNIFRQDAAEAEAILFKEEERQRKLTALNKRESELGTASGRQMSAPDYREVEKRSAAAAKEFSDILSNVNSKKELQEKLQQRINQLSGQQNQRLKEDLEFLKAQIESGYIKINNEQELLDLKRKYNQEQEKALNLEEMSFSKQMSLGLQDMYEDVDYIYGRLGRELPEAFRDGMVSALESSMDKAESFGDAMKGVGLEMMRMIRRAALEHSMSNFTMLLGMGGSKDFRNSGPYQSGGIIKAQNGMYISGGRTGDKNPAMLEDGEYVLNRKAVKAMGGKAALDNLNFSMAPRFSNGGTMMLNESINSNRMSGFFLESDNPELQEAREKAREALERRRQKRAEKKQKRQQLMSTFISTALSFGMAQASGGIGNLFQNRAATSKLTGATATRTGMTNFRAMGGTREEAISFLNSGVGINDSGIPDMQRGGSINYGFSNRDSVPAFLAGGEYVMNNRAVKKYGLGFMGRLNGGLVPAMQAGGAVGGASAAPISGGGGGGSNTNNVSINVNMGGSGGGSGEDSMGNSNANQQGDGGDRATQAKALAEKIRATVMQVISEEQRIGGSLSKDARQA